VFGAGLEVTYETSTFGSEAITVNYKSKTFATSEHSKCLESYHDSHSLSYNEYLCMKAHDYTTSIHAYHEKPLFHQHFLLSFPFFSSGAYRKRCAQWPSATGPNNAEVVRCRKGCPGGQGNGKRNT
jgi:hypothetical protein